MKGLAQHISHYQKNHTKKNTQLTHYVGIPLVFFGLFILLGWIHIAIPNFVYTHLAWLCSIALVVYYFFFDWMLALAVAGFFIVMNFIAGFISQPAPSLFGFIVFLICFVGGLGLMFVGHTIEGNKPSIKSYICTLLAAPLCFVAELFFKLGYKDDLKKEVEQQ